MTGLFAPWARIYGDSTLVATLVGFLHLAGILWGGGRAVVADVAVLRVRRVEDFLAGAGQLRFLNASHRDVVIGLVLIVVSGVLLFGADVAHFIETPLYWAKMAGVAILLINGVAIVQVGKQLAGVDAGAKWKRVRLHAGISVAFWFVVLLLGQGLINL